MSGSSEKPPIKTNKPSVGVTVEDSGSGAIAGHKSDIFFAAIETTRMPMLVTDPRQPDNPIIFANRAFVSMTGYEPEELIGQNCRFLQGPKTDPHAVTMLRDAIAAKQEVTVELINYRKDGSSFWNALFVSPVRDELGNTVYFFASQLDASRRKDAEFALARAQRMESLGQLTGGIAHDFNNLLQVVAGHLEILKISYERQNGNPALGLKSIHSARDAVKKASTLTQQLLAFSRKQHLDERPINLNTVSESIIDLVRETLGLGIELQTSLQSGLPNCRIDPSQLELALLNILVNARDAMPEGGKVVIHTEAVNVTSEDRRAFNGLRPGSYVALSVTDTGTGIPEEIIGRVMDPFFTTKEEGKGTGLGLSMVYGFAKQSGGQVSIYSEVGKGTTVRMYFPATKDHVPQAPATNPAPSQACGELIMVVDDREEVAQVASHMLESLGYATIVMSSAHRALAWFCDPTNIDKPAMLFSDIIMPGGMNGFVLAMEMRRLRSNLKVLLTTGYAGDEDSHGGGSHEFEVIHKPYTFDDLARRVRAILDATN